MVSQAGGVKRRQAGGVKRRKLLDKRRQSSFPVGLPASVADRGQQCTALGLVEPLPPDVATLHAHFKGSTTSVMKAKTKAWALSDAGKETSPAKGSGYVLIQSVLCSFNSAPTFPFQEPWAQWENNMCLLEHVSRSRNGRKSDRNFLLQTMILIMKRRNGYSRVDVFSCGCASENKKCSRGS